MEIWHLCGLRIVESCFVLLSIIEKGLNHRAGQLELISPRFLVWVKMPRWMVALIVQMELNCQNMFYNLILKQKR